MDIDISDILADVSKPFQRGGADGISSAAGGVFDYDANTAFTDHQLLVRAWTTERCVPDLLPYPSDLMGRITARIRVQITRIEDLTSGMGDPNFSMSSAGQQTITAKSSSNQNTNLVLSVLQTDLGRTQFLVRSYLRQRLAKITKHAMFYLTKHVDADTKDGESDLLSPPEVQFLRTHQALLSEFYDSSFLSGFPASLRRLDDGSGGISMVEGPDGGGGVVVQCLSENWTNDTLLGDGTDDDGPTVELRMKRGEVWVVRWRDVKMGVVKGDLEAL